MDEAASAEPSPRTAQKIVTRIAALNSREVQLNALNASAAAAAAAAAAIAAAAPPEEQEDEEAVVAQLLTSSPPPLEQHSKTPAPPASDSGGGASPTLHEKDMAEAVGTSMLRDALVWGGGACRLVC